MFLHQAGLIRPDCRIESGLILAFGVNTAQGGSRTIQTAALSDSVSSLASVFVCSFGGSVGCKFYVWYYSLAQFDLSAM